MVYIEDVTYFRIDNCDLLSISVDIECIFEDLEEDDAYHKVIVDFSNKYIGKPLVRKYVKLKNELKETHPEYKLMEINMNNSMKYYFDKVVKQFSGEDYEPSNIDTAGLQDAVRRMHREFEVDKMLNILDEMTQNIPVHVPLQVKCSLDPIQKQENITEAGNRLLEEMSMKMKEFSDVAMECEEISRKMRDFIIQNNINGLLTNWLKPIYPLPSDDTLLFPYGIRGDSNGL